MKYKLIACAVILLAAASTFTISFMMPDDNPARYVEHVDAAPKQSCREHPDGVLCTHLPIVKIYTADREIPGRLVGEEPTAPSVNTFIVAAVDIIDNANTRNHIYDRENVSSTVAIRVRGHSSRAFDKPGYYIKLINADGTNNPQKIMGMDAHHEWALHGPFLDKTLIRNYMWYNISGQIMDYAPNVRFCEVILNGEYQGLYLMTETITAGKEGARLTLEVDKKDNTFGGYALRLDWGDSDEAQMIYPFTNYTLRAHSQHEIVYPGEKNITEQLRTAIKDDFSAFEKSLYSYDFNDENYGYKSYIDVDSFVDYFLVNELTRNFDAGTLSTYVYKDIDSRLRMCVWDFNSACDYYQETAMSTEEFSIQHRGVWYTMLFKDPDFTNRVIERYYELRKTYFSEEYLFGFIDSTVEYLGDAVTRNNEVWGYSYLPEHDLLTPEERNVRSFEESITQMKDFLSERLAFLDENIDTLRQYSAPSKVKKQNEVAT